MVRISACSSGRFLSDKLRKFGQGHFYGCTLLHICQIKQSFSLTKNHSITTFWLSIESVKELGGVGLRDEILMGLG